MKKKWDNSTGKFDPFIHLLPLVIVLSRGVQNIIYLLLLFHATSFINFVKAVNSRRLLLNSSRYLNNIRTVDADFHAELNDHRFIRWKLLVLKL